MGPGVPCAREGVGGRAEGGGRDSDVGRSGAGGFRRCRTSTPRDHDAPTRGAGRRRATGAAAGTRDPERVRAARGGPAVTSPRRGPGLEEAVRRRSVRRRRPAGTRTPADRRRDDHRDVEGGRGASGVRWVVSLCSIAHLGARRASDFGSSSPMRPRLTLEFAYTLVRPTRGAAEEPFPRRPAGGGGAATSGHGGVQRRWGCDFRHGGVQRRGRRGADGDPPRKGEARGGVQKRSRIRSALCRRGAARMRRTPVGSTCPSTRARRWRTAASRGTAARR